MNLLVTGGAGFIGSHFIRYWLERYPEDRVVNLDLLTYAGNLANLEDVVARFGDRYTFVRGDIGNVDLVGYLLRSNRIDTVVNFAAESHNSRAVLDPGVAIRTNVLGTQGLMEACRREGTPRVHHVSCYDEETRALTSAGLKSFDEIRDGDMVLTLNTRTGLVEWNRVEEVVVQDYTGKMIRMKSKRVDFLVTPNHRMLFQSMRTGRMVFKEAEATREQSGNYFPKRRGWVGDPLAANGVEGVPRDAEGLKHFMYLLGLFIGDGYVASQQKLVANKSGLSKAECVAAGRDPAGRFTPKGKVGPRQFTVCNSWRVFLAVPSSDGCCGRCESTLDRLRLRWRRHRRTANFDVIYFSSEALTQVFRQCGTGARNKRIPRWALELPSEFLLPLWEGLMDADGHAGRLFHTASEQLAHQFVELCVKLGLSPVLGSRHCTSVIDGRSVEGYSYCVSVASRNRKLVRRQNVSEVDYSGKVWCLKVANKNFLVERGGKLEFCGNTCEVFGDLPLDSPESFDEEHPYRPRTPYNAAKAGGDMVVRSYHETFGLPVTLSTCANNFGPYQFPEKLIPLFTTLAIEDQPLPLYRSSANRREWLYVTDHCRAIDRILKKGTIGALYNIGSGIEQSVEEITDRILALLGKPASLKRYVPDRPGHDRRYLLNSGKIRAELGWAPEVPFEEGMRRTVDWYVANEAWWRPLKARLAVQEGSWGA
jgi:dTDP-D-glucose 4,6-dehydratase